jgi:arginase
MDLGGNQRGVDMGPSAIRLTDLVDHLAALDVEVKDMGNVLVHTRALVDQGDGKAHYAGEILRACDAAAQMTVDALDEGRVPVLLGGDHTVALGGLWGLASRFGPGGVIWVDAHADMNTPATTLSGNVHGMVLAAAMGRCATEPRFAVPEAAKWPTQCVLPEHTVLIATRTLDPGEVAFLRQSGGPRVFTIADIDRRGVSAVAEEAMEIASGAGFLHVSVDMDAMDPHDAPGVGTPVRGGLTYREAHTLMESLASAPFSSMDVVEVNPVLDMGNVTAELAAELVCSMFGKSIL